MEGVEQVMQNSQYLMPSSSVSIMLGIIEDPFLENPKKSLNIATEFRRGSLTNLYKITNNLGKSCC